MADNVETIDVPKRFVDLAQRRTRGIVAASFHDANVLRSIALSCYLQGLEDGYEAATSLDAVDPVGGGSNV